ncbi:MAG TPA: glycosyltransferase family 2 protein [Nitrospiria bacterium]|nr:glycosyltransferase family 2 protein [Nitrospiria bacterium]
MAPGQEGADDAPYVSLVIPIYNERDNLKPLAEQLLSALKGLGVTFEVLFVDDGSRDGSGELLRSLCAATPQFRLIRLRRNFGQTAAMTAGFDHSRGRVIAVMDGDLQNDPADIGGMLKALEDGADIVSGWRRDRKDTVLRVFSSKLANWLIGRVTGVRLHDYGCSLKLYRADLIRLVPLRGDLHRFIPAIANLYGATIVELPVRHHPRRHGRSKYTMARTFRVVMDLLMIRFLMSYGQRPLHIFGWLGVTMAVAGLAIDGYLAAQKLLWGVQLANRPLLLFGTLLVLAGLQIFTLGILADMLARVYHESQNRPIYAVKELVH